jgi:mannose-6-phosphate isomerase-like protein (cupin superfamily)
MTRQGSAVDSGGVTREIVAESAGMRFTLYTVAAGCEIPWHYHSAVADWYVCREGRVAVEMREPDGVTTLQPGDMADVPVGRVHRVVNSGSGVCRFALVQAGGAYDFNRVDGDAGR